jgi:glutamyl-tRNA synthetase
VSASEVRVRFAPSPTGPFHIGGARTALYNWLYARSVGGTFVLRIDDTDHERSTDEYLQNCLDSLRWLGFDWDEGPEKGGEHGPYFQGQRLEGYRTRVDQLVAEGRAYPCFCTADEVQAGRERMQKETSRPMYDRRCRSLTPEEVQQKKDAGLPYTVRIKVPEGSTSLDDHIQGHIEVRHEEIDDFVMLRQDGSPLYNLCSALDDMDMRITHVIRGNDHMTNTIKQCLIWDALGAKRPEFAHLPLILGKDGKKLSKRVANTNLLDYRDQGYPVEALVNFFTRLGWGFDAERDVFTMDEALERFKLSLVSKGGAVLDEEKLMWMCGHYIRESDLGTLRERVTPFVEKAGLMTAEEISGRATWFEAVLACHQERIQLYSELPEKIVYFVRDDLDYEAKALKNLQKKPEVVDYLQAFLDAVPGMGLPPSGAARPAEADQGIPFPTKKENDVPTGTPFTPPALLEEKARAIAEQLEVGFGQLVHPLRAALSFSAQGAGMFDIVYLLGKEQVELRLQRAIDMLRAQG